MITLENRKGKGIIFKDSDGKICLYDRNNKYYDKVMEWKSGKEIPDHYFDLVKINNRYNIIELDDNYVVDVKDGVVYEEKPVEEIIDWWLFEGEEEVETEYEPVSVYKKVIKYKTYNYDYVIGVDLATGNTINGYVKTGEIIEKECEPECTLCYNYDKIKECIQSQFETVYDGLNRYKVHKKTGLYVVDFELPYDIWGFRDVGQVVKVLLGAKEDVREYMRVKNTLKHKRVLEFAPDDIIEEFDKNKEKLFIKAGARKKWDSDAKIDRWVMSYESDGGTDGYRKSGYIDVNVSIDDIFKILYPNEYKDAKKALDDYKEKELLRAKASLKEYTLIDLKEACIK